MIANAFAICLRVQVQDSVEEVENSGFLATSSTLDVKLMANNKILQVRATTPLAAVDKNRVCPPNRFPSKPYS